MGIALLGMSQTAAIAATADPAPAVAPASGEQGSSSSPGPATDAQAASCSNFYRLYRSVYTSGGVVYGWGGWRNVSCPTSSAVVTVTLQQYTSGAWRNILTGARTVPSDSGVRVGAGCSSRAFTYWRSVIDVDLVGVSDPADKIITASRGLYCRR